MIKKTKISNWLFIFLITCLCLPCIIRSLSAATTVTGDVIPADPATWDEFTDVSIGRTVDGTLAVTEGDAIDTRYSYLGYFAGATGIADVNDPGSTWSNEDLFVGNSGNGTLNITRGGQVSTVGDSRIAGEHDSTGRVNITNANSLWTAYTLHIAYNGRGSMNITNGGQVQSEYSWIGNFGAATGQVTVDGPGSTWTNTAYFRVGYYGDGTLAITNGGTVNSNNFAEIGYVAHADSLVTVDGAGSSWTNTGDFNVGINNKSFGRVVITNGGTVTNNSISNLGEEAGSAGEVTVDGTDSTWQTDNLRIGREGSGTLQITNGGETISDSYGIVGYYPEASGHVTIDGTGSVWTNHDYLYIGYRGTGNLQISNGSEIVVDNYGVLGFDPNSFGEGTIDGFGSLWTNQNNLNLGRYGSGSLNIENGGTLITYAYGNLGYYPGSTGQMTITGIGSTWISNYIRVGRAGSGTLNIIDGGAIISYSDASIGHYTGSSGQASVIGPDSSWSIDGNLGVGRDEDGLLSISYGGLVSVQGTLTIDENSDGDSFINMSSSGMLALNGNAADSLTSFLGLILGTDAIRYWDDSAQDWVALTGAAMGTDYQLEYKTSGELSGYTVLTVLVPGPPEPDVDRDGDVDLEDLAAVSLQWLDSTCANPDWCNRADINHSGGMTLADLQLVAESWMEGTD